MLVFGTRPEAIKLAPVVNALRNSHRFQPVIVVTAQHRAILDQVLELFGIVPDYDLAIFRDQQTLSDITTRVLAGLTPAINRERPAAVVVQGDTTTTFTGALAAFYARLPVVHLEAGLRSGDVRSPYPEEMNRRLTTQLAVLHLAPTTTAKTALLRDGVAPERIIVTGNTVIDALMWAVEQRLPYTDPALHDLDTDPRRVLLVTAHRRESWGAGMRAIGAALSAIAAAEPDLLIVFPLHPNPVVRNTIMPAVSRLENIRITEPLHYGEFARLMDRSHLILTDSGGIQEEGPSLGKPVLVMRGTTERPEAITAGTARLVGTDPRIIFKAVRDLLHGGNAYAAMAHAVNPYGDGQATHRTMEALRHLLQGAPKPADFVAESASAASIQREPEALTGERVTGSGSKRSQ